MSDKIKIQENDADVKAKKAILSLNFVTYETINFLSRYKEMIISYGEKVNILSRASFSDIWSRHFLDSAQLMDLIPKETKILADMGSGAGLPSLVLAILAKDMGLPLEIHAIESIGKKADFIQSVVDELKLNVVVRRERIENIDNLKAGIITARALKALPDLLKYANKLAKPQTTCLFLKGKSLSEELTQARKYWTFDSDVRTSLSDASGNILIVRNLRHKR